MSSVEMCIGLSDRPLSLQPAPRMHARLANEFEQRLAGVGACPTELLRPEQARRVSFVDPGKRVPRTHLRPVTQQRRELARHPVADVHEERWRPASDAKGIGLDSPEASV